MAVFARRGSREVVALLLLFGLFLGSAAYYDHVGREVLPQNAPSSLNARPQGAKALYLLLSQLGYRVDRLEANWTTLTTNDGLLVVIEPLVSQRQVTPPEIKSLALWVRGGGTVLWLADAPERPLDANDPLAGDIAVIGGSEGKQTVRPVLTSPLTEQISQIAVQSPVRFRPAPHAPYVTLFADKSGPLVVQKTLGKGQIVLAANRLFTSNVGIKEADNALFGVNVARLVRTNTTLLFDEYHHGVGFENTVDTAQAGWLASLPVPLKLVLWHLVALGALLVYNGNRVFGPRLSLAVSAVPVGEYVPSMARLLRRAHASDVAFESLYRQWKRDLCRRLDIPTDAAAQLIAQRAAQRYQFDPAAIERLLARGESIVGGERIADTDLLPLAQEMQYYQRRWEFVANQ